MKIFEPRPYKPVITDEFAAKAPERRLAIGADGSVMPLKQAQDSWKWKRESRRSAVTVALILVLGLPLVLALVIMAVVAGRTQSRNDS